MTRKTPKPLINVKEGGSNFRMVGCEFEMGDSQRPILETRADNTQLEDTKVTTSGGQSKRQWSRLVWYVFAPLAVTVIGGLILYALVGA